MSFSSDVRKEINATIGTARHCMLSELTALLNTSAQLAASHIALQTENLLVAERYQLLLKQIFDIEGVYRIQKHTHSITLSEEKQVIRVLSATGYDLTGDSIKKDVNPLVVMGPCCKRAYIRGSFNAGGAISDPFKTYHMEFTLPPPSGDRLAQRLTALLGSFDLHPKTMTRKSHTVVYVKEAENIVDLLNIMEAHKSLLQLENIRILKEMRNSVNRKVNFETANLSKTVSAAVGQIEDIQYIADRVGLGYLSEGLEEVARLRLSYGEASLKEIGEMLENPVGKSGVNHRLRKISEIADALRREAQNKQR